MNSSHCPVDKINAFEWFIAVNVNGGTIFKRFVFI